MGRLVLTIIDVRSAILGAYEGIMKSIDSEKERCGPDRLLIDAE